jgi:hypothetical protein
MKKITAVIINVSILSLGYAYEENLMMAIGILCLTMVLISKEKKHADNNG